MSDEVICRQSFTPDIDIGRNPSCLRVGDQGNLYRSGDFELGLEEHMDLCWVKEESGAEGQYSQQWEKGVQSHGEEQVCLGDC